MLKRDVRSHLASTLRAFVDEIGAGLGHLGGARIDIVDRVPAWFLAGHRKEPTGGPKRAFWAASMLGRPARYRSARWPSAAGERPAASGRRCSRSLTVSRPVCHAPSHSFAEGL